MCTVYSTVSTRRPIVCVLLTLQSVRTRRPIIVNSTVSTRRPIVCVLITLQSVLGGPSCVYC